MMSPFLKALTKAHSSVHPTSAIDDIPLRKFKPDGPFTSASYDGLTDNSAYSNYAWAFLRRNRFYQSMIDRRSDNDDLAFWGHKPSPESPAIFGLVDEKPYVESHDEGQPVRWWGIHSFVERLMDDTYQRPDMHAKRDFKSAQIHVVFDIDALMGPKRSAVHLQASIARAFLLEKAVAADFHIEDAKPQKPQDKHKSRLRSMLHIADLVSPQIVSDDGKAPIGATWVTGTTAPTQQYIAKALTNAAGAEVTPTSISALGSEAFDYIYGWAFLKWLQFDNWTDKLSDIAAQNKAAQELATQRRKARQAPGV